MLWNLNKKTYLLALWSSLLIFFEKSEIKKSSVKNSSWSKITCHVERCCSSLNQNIQFFCQSCEYWQGYWKLGACPDQSCQSILRWRLSCSLSWSFGCIANENHQKKLKKLDKKVRGVEKCSNLAINSYQSQFHLFSSWWSLSLSVFRFKVKNGMNSENISEEDISRLIRRWFIITKQIPTCVLTNLLRPNILLSFEHTETTSNFFW